MNYEFEELKKDYEECLKLEDKKMKTIIAFRLKGIAPDKSFEYELQKIKNKYNPLFEGVYTDDYDYAPFTDFLLVLIRFLEQNNHKCCSSCDFYGDCRE